METAKANAGSGLGCGGILCLVGFILFVLGYCLPNEGLVHAGIILFAAPFVLVGAVLLVFLAVAIIILIGSFLMWIIKAGAEGVSNLLEGHR